MANNEYTTTVEFALLDTDEATAWNYLELLEVDCLRPGLSMASGLVGCEDCGIVAFRGVLTREDAEDKVDNFNLIAEEIRDLMRDMMDGPDALAAMMFTNDEHRTLVFATQTGTFAKCIDPTEDIMLTDEVVRVKNIIAKTAA